MTKYLDENGLLYFWQQLKTLFAGKVDKETGKGLSTNDYTTNEQTKLAGIDAGAEVNVIEGVTVNGTDATISSKKAAITVPTKTSDLTNDSNYITLNDVPPGSTASTTTPKMDGTAATGSENAFARGDHVHPTDTSRQAKITASGVLQGDGDGGISAKTVDSAPTDGSSNLVDSNGVYDMIMGRTKIYTGACSTAAGTAEKAVTLDDSTGFSLTAGVMVAVRFTYGNSATTPTLKVGSTTAKQIAIPSSATAYQTGNGTTYNTWGARETILFTYTGTYWVHLPSGYLGYLSYNLASGKQAAITASGLLKGDGSGGVSAAVAGTDYQTPLTAGTDYQTPLVAGTDYATPASVPEAGTSTPAMDGTAAVGSSTKYARADHVHPTDTSKQNKITASGVLQGDGNGGVTAKTVDSTPTANSTNLVTSGGVASALSSKLDSSTADSTYAKKTDIANAYIYRGSVAAYADLPSSGNTAGDVYDVQSDGMNYAWNGTAWDQLGATFTITSISNAEIDVILAA